MRDGEGLCAGNSHVPVDAGVLQLRHENTRCGSDVALFVRHGDGVVDDPEEIDHLALWRGIEILTEKVDRPVVTRGDGGSIEDVFELEEHGLRPRQHIGTGEDSDCHHGIVSANLCAPPCVNLRTGSAGDACIHDLAGDVADELVSELRSALSASWCEGDL